MITDATLERLLATAADGYDVPQDGADEVLADLAARDEPAPRLWGHPRLLAGAAAVAVLGAGVAALGVVDRGGERMQAETPASALAGDGGGGEAAADADRFAYAEQRRALDTADAGTAAGSTTGRAPAALSAAGGQAAAPAPAGAVGGQVVAPAVAVPTDGARVVKTGSVALVADDGDVTAVLTRVGELAAAAGGYVESSKTDEYGDTPSGTVTVRVPAARFEPTVARVRGLAEVRSATAGGRDVTASYADMEARLKTLRASRERFLEILQRTRTIGEVLTVQQRVDSVTQQIEQVEAQRRALEKQSDLATLEVSVSEDDDPVVAQRERSGLVEALSEGKDGFVGGVYAIVRHSGSALLLLLCAAAAAVVLRLGVRVVRRRLV